LLYSTDIKDLFGDMRQKYKISCTVRKLKVVYPGSKGENGAKQILFSRKGKKYFKKWSCLVMEAGKE
jgi:hypothetical protein